jgi:N-acetyl-anhydromuramyl-L-alanine amidase AmpD
MSDVRLKASRGKGTSQVTVEFKGSLTPAQWQELKEKLKALCKDYQITDVNVSGSDKGA